VNQNSQEEEKSEQEKKNARITRKFYLFAVIGAWVLFVMCTLFMTPIGSDLRLFFSETFFEQNWDELPRFRSIVDKNGYGVSATDDIIAGARAEVLRAPVCNEEFYEGGYPPEHVGTSADLIWRAYQNAGYNLKNMLDKDIRENLREYRHLKAPDPDANFRQLATLKVFFRRIGGKLAMEISPGRSKSLMQWQPGDIIFFENPPLVAVLSDVRNDQGVPYLIYNDCISPGEADDFMERYEQGLAGHFRYPRK
jgi:uncharacterized protein YijF (DUF1287 family)